MFQSLSSLFSQAPRELSEADIRHFIETWLQEQTGGEGIVCQRANGQVAEVRVSSPALQQEVLLLEYDLKRETKRETQFDIHRLRVFVG